MLHSNVAGWALALCMLPTCLVSAKAEPADTDAIKAADQAFYKALTGRDLVAMKAVWAQTPYVINIGPRSKAMNVGYDATVKYWEGAFDFFSELNVSKTEARVQNDGKTAWVVGIENATLQPKSGGDPLKFDTFVTHVFEKQGDRWLLVLHHAQMVPK
jgi:ketosteroid isomerase-like protein